MTAKKAFYGANFRGHRVLLLKIGHKLTNSDIEDLVFMSEGILSESTAEGIKSATGLFRELEHRGVLAPNDYEYLKSCLLDIGRNDLAAFLPTAEDEIGLVESLRELSVMESMHTSVAAGKKVLLYISKQLRSEDLQKLAFLCSCEVQEGLELIQTLERNGSIRDGNYKFLADLLMEVGRCDLAKVLKSDQLELSGLLQK